MNKLLSNNLAFCLSEYLANEYEINLEEHYCFLLGAFMGLGILPKNPTHFIYNIDWNKIDEYYLSSMNSFSLETFCNTFNSLLRIDQNNDPADIRWIEYDYHAFNRKTLISVSQAVLNEMQDKVLFGHHPMYAMIHIDNTMHGNSNYENIGDKCVTITYAKDCIKQIQANKFIPYWCKPNNELFNTNRYVLIPSFFNNIQTTLPKLLREGLIRQGLIFQRMSQINIINNLKENLISQSNEENMLRHKKFLQYSYERELSFNVSGMNREYFANCLECLSTQYSIINEKIVDAFKEDGKVWDKSFQYLKCTMNLSIKELLDIYDCWVEKELYAINIFVNILKRWL